MSEITAGELAAKGDALENGAACLLGHMLFEFSRLDMNLGLCLVWVDGGASIETQTKNVKDLVLKSKLDVLTKHVIAKLPLGSKQRHAYEVWIARAHSVRQLRNNLVHGRWGVEASRDKVVNVIGLPTSDSQQSKEYTLEELAEINAELRALQLELSRLRRQWPL